MRNFFLITVCFVGSLAAAHADSPIAPQPFTAESNYMSALGYARWIHYRETGAWPRSVETEYFETGDHSNDPDFMSILWTLHSMIKRNPLAREYVVKWSIDRWGTDWHDEYTGQQIYRRHDRKLLYVAHDVIQTHETRTLNDALLFQLLEKWDEFRKNERDYNKASQQWSDWWKAQK